MQSTPDIKISHTVLFIKKIRFWEVLEDTVYLKYSTTDHQSSISEFLPFLDPERDCHT
jgi:hypothetical protein